MKLAYSIKDAAEAVGVSVTTLREAINRSELTVKYPTTRPVIPAEELTKWLDALPDEPN